jgi:hypothetical protein
MTVKAILHHCHIEMGVRCWTRHATPKPFTHLCLSGVSGRQFYTHVDPGATGLFVFGAPGDLGDWSQVPALGKTPEGAPLHGYAGLTRTEQMDVEAFAASNVIEMYLQGHITKRVNGTRRDKQPFCGIAVRDEDGALLDALAAGVVWRSDTGGPWSAVDDLYKNDDGTPRVDLDEIEELPKVRPAPEGE